MTKRSVITILLTGIMVGVFLGYAWRMAQIEPVRDKEIELFARENRLLIKENKDLRGELAAWQAMAKNSAKKKMAVFY